VRRHLEHPLLHRALAFLLGAVFIYASYDKILHPGDFARVVYHYQIVGPSQYLSPFPANLLAVTLPWIEAVAGVLLIIGVWRREAALLTAAMLAVFILAVSSALFRGIDLANCGCFTVTGEGRAAGLKLILGDLGMLLCALVLAFVEPRRKGATAPAAVSEVGSHSASGSGLP
jgi:uncharacterized membrane protein YphA (DoxX/SURF4 family)